MSLHPAIAAKLHLIADLERGDLTDPAALQRLRAFTGDPSQWRPAPVEVTDRGIPGPHGEIPVRIYRGGGDAPSAVLVWAHGGGFGAGDLEMPESHVVATELAVRASATVVSVGYRLAGGGVRYPVPLDDVRAAFRWASSEPGVRRCAVGGASAGAALALATAIGARDTGERAPDVVLLAYPFVHFPNPALDDGVVERMHRLPPRLRFTPADVEAMVEGYVGRITDLPADALPGAAPLHALPPTRVVISEFDDLRSSGELLARQLRASGVETTTMLAAGMPHGHLNRFPGEAQPISDSLEFLASGLRGDVAATA